MPQKRNTEKFKRLLEQYKNGICTPDEIRELFEIIQTRKEDANINEELRKEFDQMFNTNDQSKDLPAKIFMLKSFRKYALASVASVVLIFGLYYFFSQGSSDNTNNQFAGKVPKMMNQTQAILTMENGQKIILDSASIGQISVLKGTVISLNEHGDLIYDASKAQQDGDLRTNTVSTPTGGFFKIILPDGTQVWLNSESELTFPSTFSGSQRNITLKGEGYFEVAENKEKPFKVRLDGGEEVTVLGTKFNVMTYNNEPVKKVTLLEGRVRLSNQGSSKILKPGQQAILSNSSIEIHNDAMLEHEIAWKNGLFDFQNDDLYSIMRQIARWYNVEIVDSGSGHSGHFTGSIRKSAGIGEVLEMLEVAGDVHFSIIGNKILVNNKK